MKFQEIPYQRVDLQQFNAEADRILTTFRESGTVESQLSAIREMDALTDQAFTMSTLCLIRNSLDTMDPFYQEEQQHYNQIDPLLQQKSQEFDRLLLRSPYRKELEKELGSDLFDALELQQRTLSDETIPLMQEENALGTQYQAIIASAKIPFDGKLLNLPQLVPYKRSPDRAVRKAAWEAEGKFYEEHNEELDKIFDRLVKNRNEQARKLGMKSFVELGDARQGRSCYGREEIAAFRKRAVRDLVPIVAKLKEEQAKRIGLSELKAWDNLYEFPDGNPAPKGSPMQLLEAARKMYTEMSPQTADFIKLMLDGELFDVIAREGKANSGYCTDLPAYHCPFVFANFNGTASDIDVLTHEAGHAFAAYIADREISYSKLRSPSADGCESHSMSMEFLTAPWHSLFFREDTKKYELSHIQGALYFIPYGCQGDHFQELLYSNPDMTPEERHKTWKELEAIYRPYLDYGDLPFHSTGAHWHSVVHLFLYPFYYIDYSMAQTISLQIWAESRKDWRAAWDRYYRFVQMGGTKNFIQMVKSSDLVSPLEDRCLRDVAAAVEDWLQESK